MMARPEPIVGLLSRIEFPDFLNLSEPEQYQQINQLHQTRVQAVEESKAKPKKQATKSATKNKSKKQSGAKAEDQLAKLLAKLPAEEREKLINQAKGE